MTRDESLQLAIHEAVSLVPYDAQWPALFLRERERLMSLFPARLLAVEHFGSTAVPGMPAKPIIDLLGGVSSMSAADSLAAPLLEAGYATSAEFNSQLVDRRWFMRWANGHRTHHLHLMVFEGTQWRRRLHFRDALRSNTGLARRYAELKRELAALHGEDREAYTRAKTGFVRSVLGDEPLGG